MSPQKTPSQRDSFTFLSLAPVTSSSYPQQAATRPPTDSSSTTPSRRCSIASTTGNKVLKLGPVHWGEHLDDHKDDFYVTP
ncbi:hypothetical protein CDD82_6321 [Ophiocordyceps australis]|uniref:Uncharacterized protein n=1 Tax=Ophiocordyceps australis TaxID=1399860 RepID=A0A2C5ZMQ3_9HYPO|nr:hypothetical protein CDD82_6321 [Ophiocordyceps australis]